MSGTGPDQVDSPRGLAFAVAAYGLWGFLPIYMKALAEVPPAEVIAHRVLWSLPIAAAVLLWQRRSADVVAALRQPRLLAMAALTAALISVNWLIYVWAIANGQALDAALGYYINPLFSIFLGATLLKERLGAAQIAAIALAALAVVVLALQAGRVPLVAIGLTLSWGFYAYCKRSLPLGPNQGFTLEVMLLTPVALAFVIWTGLEGRGHFLSGTPAQTLLLLGCGPITAIPLLFYANGAKLVRLSTMGILQYIAPTMIFLCAVLLFDEPMGTARMIAFPMIWMALVLYSASMIRAARAGRRLRRAAQATHRAQ
ncbi:EamA family transporter RarD [Paracoccus spongiarum]|uniref:EamA family transporter RarD n=1 Tax=Paracoccus spongiarum TaxID=3064387 RepID=A0ABT9J7W2_9RHOB|nr:EamA family transporter RarD [Paracoccus sp. 2205BS29-5]MDP5305887.1 EamA family transporter RarD [Paracoccus sp. 2205BS29-5]